MRKRTGRNSAMKELPTCLECGRAIPPEDPTSAQVVAFLEDDGTKDCGKCSALWLALLFRRFPDVLARKASEGRERCPGAENIARLIEGQVANVHEHRLLLEHLRACRDCYDVVVAELPMEGEEE
jgi:hypothetical protein